MYTPESDRPFGISAPADHLIFTRSSDFPRSPRQCQRCRKKFLKKFFETRKIPPPQLGKFREKHQKNGA